MNNAESPQDEQAQARWSTRATGVGLLAIALWSAIVGLIRGVSENFGATGGAALIYTVGSALLLLTVGPTRVSKLPRSYLIVGGGLFVAYEWCLSRRPQ